MRPAGVLRSFSGPQVICILLQKIETPSLILSFDAVEKFAKH